MRHDFVSLKLFTSIAEELSITRAAAREHIVLSAASKRITDMEAQMGVTLLQRHPRGVSLTPAGESYLHYARQILQTLARMDGELSDYSAGIRGHVRLHASASAITEFLPPELHEFLTAYPTIKIDLEEQIGSMIVRAVRDRVADLGIVAASTPSEGLTHLPYRQDRLVVIAAANHALAGRDKVSLGEVLEYDLIGAHPDSSLMAQIMSSAMEIGQTIRLRMQVRSFDAVCRLIEEGLGVGILPQDAVRHRLSAGRVAMVTLDEVWATRQLEICTRDESELSLSTKLLRDFLLAPRRPPGQTQKSTPPGPSQ